MRPEYFGTKPNRVRRGLHRHSSRQNWLGNAMKRYFVHISLIGAKWIPKSFIPQKAFCNTLAVSVLRDKTRVWAQRTAVWHCSRRSCRPVCIPTRADQTAKIYSFLFLSSSCSHITYISLPARIQAEPVCGKNFLLSPVSHTEPSSKCSEDLNTAYRFRNI